MDTPDGGKPYHHLHFYQKGKHKYCLRLDNMQPCDGTNPNNVSKKVKERVMKTATVKNVVKKYHSELNSGWVKAVIKPLLIAGAAVAVVVAAVNIFHRTDRRCSRLGSLICSGSPVGAIHEARV